MPTATKRTIRTKKIEDTVEASIEAPSTPSAQVIKSKTNNFDSLIASISSLQEEYETLQKEIAETHLSWTKEQKQHEEDVLSGKQQEDILRKREKETYEYETALARKKDEDLFLQKKSSWERELEDNKKQFAQEKQELETLRKTVATYETDKEKAIKAACDILEKNIMATFTTDKKLRDQEQKSAIEILELKLLNSQSENIKLAKQIEELKNSLETTTKELKDVAVRVIDANKPQPFQVPMSEVPTK